MLPPPRFDMPMNTMLPPFDALSSMPDDIIAQNDAATRVAVATISPRRLIFAGALFSFADIFDVFFFSLLRDYR